MVKDPFRNHFTNLSDPAKSAFNVTPDDSADLPHFTRGVSVNVTGDVTFDMVGSGDNIVLTMAAGQIYPLRVKRIRSTGTDATGIVGWY